MTKVYNIKDYRAKKATAKSGLDKLKNIQEFARKSAAFFLLLEKANVFLSRKDFERCLSIFIAAKGVVIDMHMMRVNPDFLDYCIEAIDRTADRATEKFKQSLKESKAKRAFRKIKNDFLAWIEA
jgi:hypothetical protein